MSRLCPFGKDIEDQICTVEDTHLQCFFDVSKLLGRQFIVKNNNPDFMLNDVLFDLLQLARTDKGHGMRHVQLLYKPFDGTNTGRIGQKIKLIKIFLYSTFILIGSNQPYQYSLFRLFPCDDKFLHTYAKIINFRYPYVLLLYGQAKLFRRLAGLPPEILRKERRVRKVQPVGNLLNG